MNKRTRYFLVGSTAIVVLGLCTGLVAFYSGGLSLTSSSRGPSEMAYLPADAAMVGYANVREVMTSEFRQKMIAVIPSGEERDEFQRQTGIDVENDIDTVVAAWTVGEPDKHGLVLVRGRFNDGQIEGVIRQHGGKRDGALLDVGIHLKCSQALPIRHIRHRGVNRGDGREGSGRHQKRGRSGCGNWPRCTRMAPNSAQRCNVGTILPGLRSPIGSNAAFSA